MQSPENSGNWFGLFWVPELWAYQWLWEETREPLVAAEVKTEEKKMNLGARKQSCLWGI